MSRSASRRRVVVCGSMSAYPAMEACARTLRRAGLDVVLPTVDEWDIHATPEKQRAYKRSVSRRHILHVMDRGTAAVFVVNEDKDGAFDYIGPNAFAEIAVAFAHGKRVFLYQSVPDRYRDELEAWDVTPLQRELDRLIHALTSLAVSSPNRYQQLQLFDWPPAPSGPATRVAESFSEPHAQLTSRVGSALDHRLKVPVA